VRDPLRGVAKGIYPVESLNSISGKDVYIECNTND